MPGLNEIRDQLICNGQINAAQVDLIKQQIQADGQLDMNDVKLLIELLKTAKTVCPEFDETLFSCLRHVLLEDGTIGVDEQFILLQMLYSDGEVRECEREFLQNLFQDVSQVTPEFESLCKTALECEGTNWDLGGK